MGKGSAQMRRETRHVWPKLDLLQEEEAVCKSVPAQIIQLIIEMPPVTMRHLRMWQPSHAKKQTLQGRPRSSQNHLRHLRYAL